MNERIVHTTRTAELLLRGGMALCFIGHGAFGLLRKPEWAPYFGLFGISEAGARTLMPLIGVTDILVGMLALVWPARALFAYAAAWCLWTALLRPLAGEGVWETLERAGNYGVPLALLIWVGVHTDVRGWLTRLRPTELEPQRRGAALRVCQWTTALLLAGHGMLALSGKPLIVEHVSVLGLGSGGAQLVGLVDLLLAGACLLRPGTGLLAGIAVWKLGTESLFLQAGAPVWEFVERGGSYVAPLTAALLLATSSGRARVPLPSRTAAIAVRFLWIPLLLIPGALRAQSSRAAAAPPAWSAGTGEQLRSGGYVLACRHGLTDADARDASPVNFDDPSTQRRLNAAGEQQMRAVGAALAAAGIPVHEVYASPYQRTRRSAELMFGRVQVDSALFGSGNMERRRALFTTAPAAGTNRALVTHQGVLYPMLRVPRGTIDEGDCIMIRPYDGSFTVVARITPGDWADAAAARTAQPRSIRPGSTAAARRAGR